MNRRAPKPQSPFSCVWIVVYKIVRETVFMSSSKPGIDSVIGIGRTDLPASPVVHCADMSAVFRQSRNVTRYF